MLNRFQKQIILQLALKEKKINSKTYIDPNIVEA